MSVLTLNTHSIIGHGISERANLGLSKSNINKTFSDVLEQVGVESKNEKNTLTQLATDATVSFINEWNIANQSSIEMISKVSPEYKSYIELQLSVNKLNLQTQLLTKAGETVSNSIKRVQQMGA
jgi:thiaminase